MIEAQLPNGRAYLYHVCGVCDCGTGIGCGLDDPSVHESFAKEADALRRKGWSQAKVDRWLDSKNSSVHDRTLRDLTRATKEVERYLGLARALLGVPRVERFGLMHHFYAGDVELESFNVRLSPVVCIEEATIDHLYLLPEDTLQEFRR